MDVDTPYGPAPVTLSRPHGCSADARDSAAEGLVLLGHSAGGDIDAPDLRSVTAALVAVGVSVGLVEQPYRVAGRRGAAPAASLDTAMRAVIEAARRPGERLLLGGRSSGARVACRTATALRQDGDDAVVGVLALAFPLIPPWRPDATRLPELEAVPVPVLVVQGERDHFGSAEDLVAVAPPHARVLRVERADHGLNRPLDTASISGWVLDRLRR